MNKKNEVLQELEVAEAIISDLGGLISDSIENHDYDYHEVLEKRMDEKEKVLETQMHRVLSLDPSAKNIPEYTLVKAATHFCFGQRMQYGQFGAPKLDKAIHEYKKSLTFSDSAVTHLSLARSYAKRENGASDLRSALEHIDNGLKLVPPDNTELAISFKKERAEIETNLPKVKEIEKRRAKWKEEEKREEKLKSVLKFGGSALGSFLFLYVIGFHLLAVVVGGIFAVLTYKRAKKE